MTEPLSGEKILVTGPAGQIAFPLVSGLARDNEVWGIARLRDPVARERVEKAGVQTRSVDLADPEWGDLPTDFTILLHIAAAIHPTLGFDEALRVNAEGTGRLMSHFRNARACLSMSTGSVYASPEDVRHPVAEGDPMSGTGVTPFSPTYTVSKIGQEAVARFAAQEYDLPTVITRMDVAYGDNGGLPAMLLDSILAGESIPLAPGGASLCNPIHEDDILGQLPALLAAADVPATITNWAGDDVVELSELCRFMARLVGREVNFLETDQIQRQSSVDVTRRRSLTGACRVGWRDGIRRMIAARHPELPLRDV